jgi:RNA-binding protein YlmH
MHKNHNKVDCALKNLEMGTSKDNATGNKRVTLSINGVKNTYDSIHDAARKTGILQTTISKNIKRERYGELITSNGITFMLVKNRKRKRYDTPITPSKRVKFMLVDDDEEESKESEESDESESDEEEERV